MTTNTTLFHSRERYLHQSTFEYGTTTCIPFYRTTHLSPYTGDPHSFEWQSVGGQKHTHQFLSYVSNRHTLKMTKTIFALISLIKNDRYRLTLQLLTQRIITAQVAGPEFSLQKCLLLLQIYMKHAKICFLHVPARCQLDREKT